MYCRDAYEKKISSKKKPSKPKKMKKPVPIGDVSIASSWQYIQGHAGSTHCHVAFLHIMVNKQKIILYRSPTFSEDKPIRSNVL